jgi:surfeit locus 1 family protein
MSFTKMFSRKWVLTTLFVLFGIAVCIRLGIWQLDRLEGRRAFNAQVISNRALPVLDLNHDRIEDLHKMEWRPVRVVGVYDFEHQVALRNQIYLGQLGYHLITPLLLSDTSTAASTSSAQRLSADGRAVFVDRGWIPADGNSLPADWRKYDELGEVTVTGQLRLGQTKPSLGGVADALPENGKNLEVWNNLDVVKMSEQSPYPILPIFIQPNVEQNDSEPPIPYQPEVDITEGPHFGYAIQWFTFAAILFVGYPFYLRKQEAKSA